MYENYKELPITENSTTIDKIPAEAQKGWLDIQGTEGTITAYRSLSGNVNTWQEVDTYTMSGTHCVIALVGIVKRGFIKFVTNGTITAANILWGD